MTLRLTSAARSIQLSPYKPLAWLTLAVVGVRVVLSLWAAFVLAHFPVAEHYAAQPVDGITAPWQREDAIWYTQIASQGYEAENGSTEFFPLFPLLARVASVVTGADAMLAGMLLALVACTVAAFLLYKLAEEDGGTLVAGRSVAYLLLFPTAFFLFSPYTESLFLALALAAFWLIRRKYWLAAAALALLAGLTKAQGALLGVALAVDYFIPLGWAALNTWRRWLPRLTNWRLLVSLAVLVGAGVLGTGLFFLYRSYVIGDPLSWTERQFLMWRQRVTWPGETLWLAVQNVLGEGRITINAFDLSVLLLFTLLTIAAFRLRLSYGVYAAVILLSTWLHTGAQFPLMSVSRFVLVAFPCFIMLAQWSTRRHRYIHIVIIGLWLSLLLVWTMQSVLGHWVG